MKISEVWIFSTAKTSNQSLSNMTKIFKLLKKLQTLSFVFLLLFSPIAISASINSVNVNADHNEAHCKELSVPAQIQACVDNINSGGSVNNCDGTISCLNIFSGITCIFPYEDGNCKDGKEAMLSRVNNWLIGLAVPFAILVMIWGGYKYYFSAFEGDSKQGRQAILAGAMGLGVVLLAPAAIDLIQGLVSDDGTEFCTAIVYEYANKIVMFAIYTGVALAIVAMLWSGLAMVRSSGDSEAFKNGRNGVQNAAIGLVIILTSMFIVILIKFVLNETLLSQLGSELKLLDITDTVTCN